MAGAALARKASRMLVRMLTHSYTRTSVAPGDTEDAWGDESSDPGTGTSGLRCLYGSQDRLYREPLTSDGVGARTIRVPTLFVGPDDPLAVGDVVTNVLDAAGAVLVPGPLTVEAVTLNAEVGISLLKEATLRETVGRRSE